MLLGGRWAKSMRQYLALSVRFSKLRCRDRQSRFHIFYRGEIGPWLQADHENWIGTPKKMMNLEKI